MTDTLRWHSSRLATVHCYDCAAPGPTGPAGGLPGLRGHQHRPAHRHLRAGPGSVAVHHRAAPTGRGDPRVGRGRLELHGHGGDPAELPAAREDAARLPDLVAVHALCPARMGRPLRPPTPASRIPDRRRSDDGRSMRRRAPPTHRTAARPRSDGWPAGNCLPLSSVDRAPAADSEALRTAHDRRPCSSFGRSQRVPATYGVVGEDVRCHRRRRVRSSQAGRSAEAAR
jgi:hypothetical protein